MRPVIGRPTAAAVVAAIHHAATPGPGGQIWLPLPRPRVQVAGGPAVGSPFAIAGAARSWVRSASRGGAGGKAPMSVLLRNLRGAKGPEQVTGIVDQLVGAGVLGEPRAMHIMTTVEEQARQRGGGAPPPDGRH